MTDAPIELRGSYSTKTAAAYLSTSQRRVQMLVADGVLPAFIPYGMKRGYKILRRDLDAYLERSAAGTTAPDADVVPLRSAS